MYIIKKIIISILKLLGYELVSRSEAYDQIVTLKPEMPPKGNVLLAYVLEPFLSKDPGALTSHTHFGESVQIAETYLELGYRVDIIDYRNHSFIPRIPYTLFVSARVNFETIAGKLNEDCIKVVHLDTAHWMFNNSNAYNRYMQLQKRRGVTIPCNKILEQTWAIEKSDCATILGNNFTMDTYAYANKPIHKLPVPTCQTYNWPASKKFEACRGSFIWLGSGGVVNKGLDITLEAFSKLPQFRLFVCGPIEEEKVFYNAYYHELNQLPNIKNIGWIDVGSNDFLDITRKCVAVIYPSCSEGQSGAVITCMQAGLIPIISYESGIDVYDFGTILMECTIDEIQSAVLSISNKPADDLKQMSKKSWEYANKFHTLQAYKKAYKDVALKILSTRKTPLTIQNS